jgi:hypothetical protein
LLLGLVDTALRSHRIACLLVGVAVILTSHLVNLAATVFLLMDHTSAQITIILILVLHRNHHMGKALASTGQLFVHQITARGLSIQLLRSGLRLNFLSCLESVGAGVNFNYSRTGVDSIAVKDTGNVTMVLLQLH